MVPMTLALAAVLGVGGDLEGVVLDFTSPKCGPCQQMSPVVSRLERQGYRIRKVECESNRDLVNRFNIQTIPAFVLVVNGEEKARLNGIVSEQQLIQMCARIPQPQDSADSLGAPAELPTTTPSRGNADFPTPSSGSPKQAAPAKSGMSWPFGSKKKKEPAREPQEVAVQRGKADDRRKISVPVVGSPLAATVRIRVRDAKGDSYGTGTIIDSRVGQTIIVTCGHIFRSWDQQARIEVDRFDEGREQTIVAKHLYHDLKTDVGLITINADWVPSCRIAPAGTKFPKGTPVITVGCSGGDKPTVQHLKISALNRYKGSDNIEVGGMPVEGRSGGGLFTKDGLVIGVCSGADPHYKEGYYVGLKTLHELLDHCHLSRLYRAESAEDNAAQPLGSAIAQVELGDDDEEDGLDDGEQVAAASPPRRLEKQVKQQEVARVQPQRRPVERAAEEDDADGAIDTALEQAGEAEIVCIIRPVNRPGAASRVVILNKASRRFVEYLTDELDERPEIVETTLKTAEEKPRVRKVSSTQKVKRPTVTETRAATTVEAVETKSSGPQAYRRKRAE